MIFLRFSMLHMMLAYTAGHNFFLLYIFSIPAFIGIVAARGFARSFDGPPAKYWLAFAIWMGLATPFSIWRGASAELFYDYLRTDLPMLFVAAGLILTWKECKKVAVAIALSSIVNMVTIETFQKIAAGRIEVKFGVVGNANDFAGHLILVLPFLLWMASSSKVFVWRIAALGLVGYGLILILKTGSRGAAVALAAQLLFVLIRGSARQRITLLVMVPVVAAIALSVVPQDILGRLRSFGSGPQVDEGALESSLSRTRVFKLSLEYMIRHPIFGVGPGQFSIFEGTHDLLPGMAHGSYLDTHNSYTQPGSECGVPGLFFFLAGTITTIILLNKTYKQARSRPDCEDIRSFLFFTMMAVVGFYTCITFLNFAYFFYEPFLGGFAIALARAANAEFRQRSLQSLPDSPFRMPASIPIPVVKRTRPL
jgi:O-antigen ligase